MPEFTMITVTPIRGGSQVQICYYKNGAVYRTSILSPYDASKELEEEVNYSTKAS